jgi:hypothetical protein
MIIPMEDNNFHGGHWKEKQHYSLPRVILHSIYRVGVRTKLFHSNFSEFVFVFHRISTLTGKYFHTIRWNIYTSSHLSVWGKKKHCCSLCTGFGKIKWGAPVNRRFIERLTPALPSDWCNCDASCKFKAAYEYKSRQQKNVMSGILDFDQVPVVLNSSSYLGQVD